MTCECRTCGKVTDQDIQMAEDIARLMVGRNRHKGLCEECSEKIRTNTEACLRDLRIEDNLLNSGIEAEFSGTWNSKKGNRDLANAIRENSGKHLFVVGEYGVGKTRCTCVNLERQIRAGKRGKYYEFNELAHKYSKTFKDGEEAPKEFIARLFRRRDIVIIDDLCKKEKLAKTAAEFCYELLNHIYAAAIPCRVWITSNTVPAELHKKFESRDLASAVASRIDRLHDAGKLVMIKAEDLEK
jgi:DNA replication protein DnaC